MIANTNINYKTDLLITSVIQWYANIYRIVPTDKIHQTVQYRCYQMYMMDIILIFVMVLSLNSINAEVVKNGTTLLKKNGKFYVLVYIIYFIRLA